MAIMIESTNSVPFADALLSARRERGLTQLETAQAAGTNVTFVTALETGRNEPKGSTLRKLAGALSLEWIVTDKGYWYRLE